MSRSFFNGGLLPQVQPAADPPATRFGWDNDLLELPNLEFDASLSSSITEAQMLAGLSISSGSLRISMAAMRAAGAGTGAIGVAWLAGRIWSGPAQLYMNANSAVSTFNLSDQCTAGIALYYYASDAELSPSSPPNAIRSFMTLEFGLNSSGVRGYNHLGFASGTTSQANTNFIAGTLDWLPYSNARSGIVRSGDTYPPNTSSSVNQTDRAVLAAPMGENHRGRPALIVRLTGSGVLSSVDIRVVQLDYRPI